MKILSKKSYSSLNYYLDFHKEKSINSASKSLANIFSKSLLDDDYIIPQPHPNTSISFFADTYLKQVLAVLMNNQLLDSKEIMQEAKEKANQFLKIKGFNIGAYSDSKGLPAVRKSLGNWYFERDGYKINEDHMYIANGGINCYDHIISLICESGECVLLPNPTYPLYTLYNQANAVKSLFYSFEGMEEGQPKGIDYIQLGNTVTEERAKGAVIKAMVIINPNNPLGTIQSESEMEEVVKFCEKNSLVLIAVESLQNSLLPRIIKGEVESLHSNQSIQSADITLKDCEGNKVNTEKDARFKSFRYMVNKLKSQVELFSIYSASKGPFYNQSHRAGLLDTMNLDEEVSKQLYKYKSIDLCSNVTGQLDLTLNKPREFGYEFLFNFEQSLNEKTKRLHEAKNQLYQILKEDEDIVLRDIQAGHSFFVKSADVTKNIKMANKKVQITPGSIYGHNMENYFNLYINL